MSDLKELRANELEGLANLVRGGKLLVVGRDSATVGLDLRKIILVDPLTEETTTVEIWNELAYYKHRSEKFDALIDDMKEVLVQNQHIIQE